MLNMHLFYISPTVNCHIACNIYKKYFFKVQPYNFFSSFIPGFMSAEWDAHKEIILFACGSILSLRKRSKYTSNKWPGQGFRDSRPKGKWIGLKSYKKTYHVVSYTS